MLGINSRRHVVVFRRGWDDDPFPQSTGSSRATVPQDGNREMVTVIDFISADGREGPPLIIFKGKQMSFAWSADSKLRAAYYTCSDNGWTTHEHNLPWLKDVFEPETRDRCPNGEWRALIFDNHKVHIDYPTVKFCLENKILCCTLPSKTSGVLQPLDVACFRPYQQVFGKAVENETSGRVTMTKQDFAR
jgi:hypothetical protein